MTDTDIDVQSIIRVRQAHSSHKSVIRPPLRAESEIENTTESKTRKLWPATFRSAADLVESVQKMPTFQLDKANTKTYLHRRRTAVRELLAWLEGFDGASWQEKWERSQVEDDLSWTLTISAALFEASQLKRKVGDISFGASWLLVTGAVRPTYEWLHRQHEILRTLPAAVLGIRDPSGTMLIDQAIEKIAGSDAARTRHTTSAHFQLARILVHTGKLRVAEISPEDLTEARESARGQRDRLPSGAAYNVMAAAGLLPPGAPATFNNSRRAGRLPIEELVDRTGIRSANIRDLFVDYFRARSAGLDYTSLTGLIQKLVLNFWVEIEGLEPGIDTLTVSPELVDRWKERITIVRHGTNAGKPRKDRATLYIAVRGFYFDINDWAQSDPERYAHLGAPNPIGPDDTNAFSKEKHRQRARSHQRTRERLPHLPALMDLIRDQLRWHRNALNAARKHLPGERFEVDGIVCEIAVSTATAFGGIHRSTKRQGGITVLRLDSGKYFDAVQAETIYFWRWAAFSVLRETGIRIEEMEELTHASIAQYRMPSTGELLPLLQIAPSKTDRERVILVSPELADVLAAIIARVRDSSQSGRIPLVKRWDYQEKELSEPMPFLFQRRIEGQDRAINRAWVLRSLRATVEELGLVDEAGEPIYFQNHDMRRIFATEAVMAGLPVHILANVLGHESLETTQQYMAIYDEDVYKRHRAFIERRRAIRPSSEYRRPTDAEFEEFLGHFERRQLELGTCGRAYGTPCIHEHACVRCSMLQPDPKQTGRLREIMESLQRRIAEAQAHGWFGEIEGLEVSLAGARQKLASMEESPSGPVLLGLPTMRPLN